MSSCNKPSNLNLLGVDITQPRPENSVHKVCKLMLPEHLATHLEERELDRDIEPVQCRQDIIDKIFGNYYIVKNILRHLHWQDKLVCKDVCLLWDSAVKRLQLEQLGPVDFSINTGFFGTREGEIMLKSSEFYTKPMAVFTFCRGTGMPLCSIPCENSVPRHCTPSCDMDHNILDIVHHLTTAPEDCMYVAKAYYLLYMPLPSSPTIENLVEDVLRTPDPSFYGIYIPEIPGVKFMILNSKTCVSEMQDTVLPLLEDHTIRGIVACFTDNSLNYNCGGCLEFLGTVQPDTPFALGGCFVEDTTNNAQDLVNIVDCVNKGKEFSSENLLSHGIFLTPKIKEGSASKREEPCCNFQIYSFVIEPSDKIKEAVLEFSECVPRFEHSVALKFSCLERFHLHEQEQQIFRACFPDTRIGGCFGNGELGVNHFPTPSLAKKRPRKVLAYDKLLSYTTVFFYIGWGNITKEARCDN